MGPRIRVLGRSMQKGHAYDAHMLLLHIKAYLLLIDFLCAPSCVGVLCIEDSGCDYGFTIRCVLLSWQMNSEAMLLHVNNCFCHTGGKQRKKKQEM